MGVSNRRTRSRGRRWPVIAAWMITVLAIAAVWTGPAAAKVVVTFNNGPREGDVAQERIIGGRIARFNAVYPDIEIRPDPWQFDPQSFVVKMAGGTATDVIGVFATELAGIIDNGFAADITEYVKSWQYFDSFSETALAPGMRDGRIYAIPVGAYIMGLYYNKRLFKEAGIVDEHGEAKPPTTWEEFVDAAVKLTDRKRNISGFGIMGKGAQAGWQFLNWAWQAGGDFERQVDGRWKAVFDEEPVVEALRFIQDLRWTYDVLQPNVLLDAEGLFPLIAAGQVAMAFLTPEWVPVVVRKYGGKLDEIGLAPLPAGPAGRANQMGGGYAIVNPSSPPEVQEAAVKWILWEFDPRNYEAELIDKVAEGDFVGLPQSPIFVGELQQLRTELEDKYRNVPRFEKYVEEAPLYVRPEPPYFAQALYSEALGPAVEAVLTNPFADPEKLLRDAARQFEERFLRRVGPQ